MSATQPAGDGTGALVDEEGEPDGAEEEGGAEDGAVEGDAEAVAEIVGEEGWADGLWR